MKLTKRGWNNVLLLGSLMMIFLFNTMNNKLLENSEGQQEAVLPPQSMLLTLEYPDLVIERLGRHWRTVPGKGIEPASIEVLVDHWLQLMAAVSGDSSDEQGIRILLWLATEEHPRRLWLQPRARLLTDIHRQRSWRLSQAQLQQLLPSFSVAGNSPDTLSFDNKLPSG